MNHLTSIKKFGASKVCKRSLVVFLGFFISAVIFTACHKKPVNVTNLVSETAHENLNILYLNNTPANPELKHLLEHSQGDVEFQFYHYKSGVLSLNAWPLKDTSGTYNKNDAKILNGTAIPYLSIAGIDVNLGNLNLDVNQRDTLYRDTNKTAFEFILFYPKIQVDSLKGINHVVYDIYGAHTLPPAPSPTLMIHTPFLMLGAYMLPPAADAPPIGVRITTLAKPSPPYVRN